MCDIVLVIIPQLLKTEWLWNLVLKHWQYLCFMGAHSNGVSSFLIDETSAAAAVSNYAQSICLTKRKRKS
ncbi:Hypothetical predicted protein [Octopus vulgaris]|uniref:Uncharacterized protein n=1 Tax=Octopus vulgaris TaxID=6645 RepID=A0AA36FFI5_OCTVU|nr:Hypothetical predicted protein [Octopus vulgaris]